MKKCICHMQFCVAMNFISTHLTINNGWVTNEVTAKLHRSAINACTNWMWQQTIMQVSRAYQKKLAVPSLPQSFDLLECFGIDNICIRVEEGVGEEFHQHCISSFYAGQSQKRKKTASQAAFCAFRICKRKSCT